MTRVRADGAGGPWTWAPSRRSWRPTPLGCAAPCTGWSPRRCRGRGTAPATYAFDDTAAWLVTHCSKSTVRDLLRIAWRTVGSMVSRVVADAEATTDRFADLRRVGIDEISYKRGHKVPYGRRRSRHHALSNARVESVNTKLRLLTRIAFGFRSRTPPRNGSTGTTSTGCTAAWATGRPASTNRPTTIDS